ncbi:2-amino-4-hydroxy-6-hydroxymethyldihydropteridine pyrophosphokinase [mine drainage metagenome]|uniref:2-amino-4-hydroxy-6-hydroxymethyldihydropteridine diphosphokinase n=1 Tax=mine drainage metagenome TaxID=410659 RepID=T1BYX6_9ZZZZ
MTLVYIGLGANLGQPEAQLRSAFSALDALARTHLQARSRLWRTPAWGHSRNRITATPRLAWKRR